MASTLSAADQVEVLMLPKNTNSIVQFYSLTEDHTYNSNLPETTGKVCFASLGWLITVTGDEEEELKFNMLRPSNRVNIELPDGGAALFRRKICNISKFALSSNLGSTSDYIVMFHTLTSLAYCRPGLGQGWKSLTFEDPMIFIMDITYYQGNFYVLDYYDRVSFVCDIEDPERAHLSVVAPNIREYVTRKKLLGPKERIKNMYLVESAGSLLVVLCITDDRDYVETFGCRVFKVSFSNGNPWSDSEVKNLGNTALFLNPRSSSFSMEVTGDSGCKANCIYFITNFHASPQVDLDVGIFNMEDGTIDRDLRNTFNIGDFMSRESHLWIQPSL